MNLALADSRAVHGCNNDIHIAIAWMVSCRRSWLSPAVAPVPMMQTRFVGSREA